MCGNRIRLPGQENEGRAFVYLGSSSGILASPTWTAESNQDEAHLGRAVASAGDVNGDGYGDVVVGAETYDGGNTDEGAAFVYFGNGAEERGPHPVPVRLQALRTGMNTPVAPKGLATSSAVDVIGKGRSSFGRGGVRLQVELTELGVPFDSMGMTQTSLSDRTITGVLQTAELSGLLDDTRYHYPARIAYDPADGFKQLWGPWSYGGLSGEPLGTHLICCGVVIAPTLTTVATLTGAVEDTELTISYDTLAAAADEESPDGDELSFRVGTVSTGTLEKDGTAIVAGTTLLSAGESWVWTPATNANGTLNAFTVEAWDGEEASSSPVQVTVNR